MGVRSLLQQFETLLSPARQARTPYLLKSAAAHTAWEQATTKKWVALPRAAAAACTIPLPFGAKGKT